VFTLLGAIVGIGALVFAGAVLRGDRRDVHHVLHWVRRAGLLAVLGATLELVAQVAVEGGGWKGLWSPSVIGTVIASSFGIAVALRIAGGVALTSGARIEVTHAANAPDPVVAIKGLVSVGAGPALPTRRDGERPPEDRLGNESGEPYLHHGDQAWLPTSDSTGAVLGALALVAAHLFDGHTVTKGDRIVTAIVDVVHVVGGAVWAGGVFVLVAVLWRRHRQGRELRALQLAVRFSVIATLALVAVGAAGAVLTVIVLDTFSELWTTEWGRTLLVKTAFVALAAAAGGYNHKVLIPQLHRASDNPALSRRFQTIVTAEAAALIAVLIATALLMGAAS
jgi:copper transport protein